MNSATQPKSHQNWGWAITTFRPFEVYFVLLVAYAALTYSVSILIGVLHRYLNRHQEEGAA